MHSFNPIPDKTRCFVKNCHCSCKVAKDSFRRYCPYVFLKRKNDCPHTISGKTAAAKTNIMLGLILLLLGLIAFAVHFFMNLDMELLRDAPFCIMLAAMVLAVGGGIIWIFRNIKYR